MTTTNKTPRQRRSRGQAWHWKQTDAWYYTPPGTKRRVALRDEAGRSIRGQSNRLSAELALARIKAAGNWQPAIEPVEDDPWVVARVCSLYIEYCEQRAAKGTLHPEYRAEVTRYLNQFSAYCGAVPVSELRKGHVQRWLEQHPTWKSTATQRNAITVVLSAFHHAREEHGIPNPLTGLQKPPQKPRLISFTADDEQLIYAATDEPFRDFLFAAVQTGLRPFCELAKLTADDVEETPRGMMWRVFSSKTGKIRKIPVSKPVAKLTRRLLKTCPVDGITPIFRNPQGRPWKKVTGVHRFLAIKRKLGWDQDPVRKRYSCYICRHTFAHRMLAGFGNNGVGCSIEVLAELMGDTPKTCFDHYGKEWGQHYQDPLWAAIGVE